MPQRTWREEWNKYYNGPSANPWMTIRNGRDLVLYSYYEGWIPLFVLLIDLALYVEIAGFILLGFLVPDTFSPKSFAAFLAILAVTALLLAACSRKYSRLVFSFALLIFGFTTIVLV